MAEEPRRRLTRHDLKIRVRNAGLAKLLADSQPFREFVWTIFIEAGIFYPTYRQGHPDHSAHLEGRRALGLEVLHMLKAVRPDILALIEREGELITKQQEPPGDDDDLSNDDP